MEGRNTLGVLFYIRKNRPDKNGKVDIIMRITANGEQSAISTNRKISPKSWDKARRLAKQKSKEGEDINPYLETLRTKVYEAHRQIIDEGKVITPNAILSLVSGHQNREYSLLKLVERHNQQMEKSLGISTSNGNYKNFKTSLIYLREFVEKQYGRKDILLTEVNVSFIGSYVLFLQTEKNCHQNGAMKKIQRLKKVVNMGLNYGWITRSPFIGYNIRFKPFDKIILTADELSNIEKLTDLTPKLALTRDAFVFSCYTGLAFVDLKNLTYDSVVAGIDGNLWIITRRKKTETKARISLLPKALELMERYKNHPKLQENHVLPLYSNQKTNDYLKKLAEIAEIKKPLTFHCGRHIFATIITLANGMPIETVSKALGHKDIRTTQVYARVVDEKIAADFTALKNKLLE